MPARRAVYRSEPGRLVVTGFYRRILDEAPSALRRRFVPTGEGRTHLLEAGPEDGDVVLLLHGSASNSATWLGDIPVWARAFRVVAADIPGHPGLSEGLPLALSSPDTAAWLQGLLDQIGAETVRMVGMSLGGWAALDYATRHPDRIRGLSLLAPAGLAPVRGSFVLRALPLSLLGKWGSDRTQHLVFGGREVPPPVLEFGRLVARHHRPPLERPRVFTDPELGRLQMPIQFFAGTRDALVRAADSARRLARVAPQAEVHLLEGEGHAILGRAEQILSFLEGC
ncbi:MAG: alpha/beta fold hydrolase [Acidimicrobiia bacterium]|nr:alpha/beta fold hydrolase [Acidimicrobiia bacterium]